MTAKHLLSLQEISDRTGLSYYQVYRRVVRGDLAAVAGSLDNGKYLVEEAELAAWIDAGMPMTSPRRYKQHPDTVSVSDVARATGYTPETVRRLCHEKAFEWFQPGGSRSPMFISRASFEAFMNQLAPAHKAAA